MSTPTLERADLRSSEGDPLAPAYHPEHSVEHRPEHQAPRDRTGSHRVARPDDLAWSALFGRLASLLAWGLGALGLLAGLIHFVFGAGAFVELSDSMSPQYHASDLVLTRLKSPDALSIGDVIVVVPPGESIRVAHRIVAIAGPPTAPVLTTKGDANPAVDAWRVTARSDVAVAVAKVPGGGRAVTVIHSDALRALLVLLIGLGLTAWLVRRMLPDTNCPPDCPEHPGSAHAPRTHVSSTDQENE